MAPSSEPARWPALRLLTRPELQATAASLWPSAAPLALDAWPPDGQTRVESGVASNLWVAMSDQRLATLTAAAQRAAELAVSAMVAQGHCAVRAGATTACLDDWLATVGARAFRRPLEANELDRLRALHRTETEPLAAARATLEGLLSSPQALFHVELGEGTADAAGHRRLRPLELAARLSYFVAGSPPDDALQAAAVTGALANPEGRAHWARQVFRDGGGARWHLGQVSAWLELDGLPTTAKSPALFAGYDQAFTRALLVDAQRGLSRSLVEHRQSLASWLVAPVALESPVLTAVYRGPGEASRRGPLMHPGWLARHAGGSSTSPTRRGKFITERLLCQSVPPPPANLEIPPVAEDDGTRTTRQRFEAHGTLPCASACHGLMDPLGFSLEGFDAVGRHRPVENGQRVDTAGSVRIKDVVGRFADAPELLAKVAGSEAFFECLSEQWLERGLGEPPSGRTHCEALAIGRRLHADAGTLEDLVAHVAASTPFTTTGACRP